MHINNRNRLAYSIEELSAGSGASRSKIYQEIASGRLKARKLGSRTIVLPQDGEEWLRSLPLFEPAASALPEPDLKQAHRRQSRKK
jgi:predicted DNA-binding transcriptional regulator AlpA